MTPTLARVAFLPAVSVVALVLIACDRADTDPPGPDPHRSSTPTSGETSFAKMGPSETVRYVHGCRVSGRSRELARFLLPDQRPYIIELIDRVDLLARANQVLTAAVREHIGAGSAVLFDRAQVANMIGVFSNDVEVIDERVDGDTAVVTIQVAGRVPLDEVSLVRRKGRWLIKTDKPVEGLADELRSLAQVLVETAHRLERQPMTAAELKRELAVREAAVSRRLAALFEKQPT